MLSALPVAPGAATLGSLPSIASPGLVAALTAYGFGWLMLATATWQYGVTHLEAGRSGVILIAELLVGLLTGILYLVGGPMNPFSIVYLVGVTVAATSLGHWWAIALGLVSISAYAFTFVRYQPLEFVDPELAGSAMALSSFCVLSNALLLKRWRLTR